MRPSIYLRVVTLSAASLLLEGALLRLLAVTQFYHFAFLVVSLALLGFGASGSLLSIWPRLKTIPPDRLLAITSLGFTLSTGLAYAVVNLLPFDSYSIAWEKRQIFFFILYYLALTLPFLFAGLGIGGGIAASQDRSHLIYAANLLGSGIGAILAPLILWLAGVPGATLASALIGMLGGLTRKPRWVTWALGFGLFGGLVGLVLLGNTNFGNNAPMGMTISPYKGLAQAQRYPGSSVIFRRWNAISRVDVIADAGIRQLPGLSYTYAENPPPQYGLSLDGDSPQPITLTPPGDFAAADYMPEALAFKLRPEARVLVLEPGGGLSLLQALAGGSHEITAVAGNPLDVHAVAQVSPLANPYNHPNVETVIETSRVFLKGSQEDYGLIFIPLTDGFRPITSGAFSLVEDYNLTVEAFEDSLAHLKTGGILVITRWLQSPPSESLRLIATLAEAIERHGGQPADSLIAYRGIQTITVLIHPDGWKKAELDYIREFTAERKYDLVWAPDIQPSETNRFNRLPKPEIYLATRMLLKAEDRDTFIKRYPFDIQPPTDNHPFFFHFFTWEQTPEILATLGHTWQPFGGSGFFILLALLALVILLSLVLIMTPLLFHSYQYRKSSSTQPSSGEKPPMLKILIYFSFLGIAFLFVEIPLIQRWILLLGHPTYAFAVVVMILLLFSGLGSSLSRSPWVPRKWAFGLLVALALLTPIVISLLTNATLGWPLLFRSLVAALSLAPLALLMGLPFPLGLAWLETRSSQLIPWAWAVNGCASVIASVLAAILSLSYGFTVVLLIGAGAYAGAFTIFATNN